MFESGIFFPNKNSITYLYVSDPLIISFLTVINDCTPQQIHDRIFGQYVPATNESLPQTIEIAFT